MKEKLSKENLIALLSTKGEEKQRLFERAALVKKQHVGNKVYLRGLIELSNRCQKDCYYCGIRHSNHTLHRYMLSHDETMKTVMKAYEKGYGSVTIQSGEWNSPEFIARIDRIVRETKQATNGAVGITLSCGEQCKETYRRWFESGADRYLLRVETSSEALYRKLHPNNSFHTYLQRVKALEALGETGYQVGTGVMIGLPFQTIEQLADDLLFMQQIDIDMCGMGPYIEHPNTPLYAHRDKLLPLEERLHLSWKMVALLRILMNDINIAATTALEAIDGNAREKAIAVGANVVMPNITPSSYRPGYLLYENKPLPAANDNGEGELTSLERRLYDMDHVIAYFQQGNSARYEKRIQSMTSTRQ
ncbi:MAG TPA: [FeFe] hydrogenase H-cluster radical SAM maturase HydE [Bacteroidales bacterium]|jgi:biotin synthase|nr:[FeFe] hydrogenase H-cluster radical SAM maturase HydE [Bacteroidales bacterium]